MKVVKLVAPPLENNVYIVYSDKSKEACIIDVAMAADAIQAVVETKDLDVKYIINTHAHIDHTAQNKKVKGLFPNSKLAIHEGDLALLREFFSKNYDFMIEKNEYIEPDLLLKDGDSLTIGEFKLEVIHTPGHTPGSICLYEPSNKVLFSGDTLFQGTYGRVDFPYSDEEKMMESLKKLAKLPKETIVYPGHGSETRIGAEYWLFNL